MKITGWSPLHASVAEDDTASVEYLILQGANLTLKGSKIVVANGAKLTPKEFAHAIGFENMLLFNKAKMAARKVQHDKQEGKSEPSVQEKAKPICQHTDQTSKTMERMLTEHLKDGDVESRRRVLEQDPFLITAHRVLNGLG